MENLTQRGAQSGTFFQKPVHFFRFSKRVVEASSLPLVALVNVAKYASVTLNMLKYP